MVKTRYLREDSQKFYEEFKKLTNRHSGWKIWGDFIMLLACTLSACVDAERREKRLERIEEIHKRYSDEEIRGFVTLCEITEAAITGYPDQDFLGELFSAMEFPDRNRAQFFTPYNVCKMMAAMVTGNPKAEVEEKGMITINDPCCGAGATLIAAVNVCRDGSIDIGRDVLVVGQDIDPLVAMMCYIQLWFMQCAGYILVGNSLLPDEVEPNDVWVLPKLYQKVWLDRGVMEQVQNDLIM